MPPISVALGWLVLLPLMFEAKTTPTVSVEKTPNGGIQPQAVADAEGTIHLVYFKGEAKAGDLYYVTRKTGHAGFSKPVRVNSTPGTAIAVGSIRGGQLALGQGGRLHVVWNGATPVNAKDGCPLYYTRLKDTGKEFEPQRNLIHATVALDGGGSVAADPAGNVYVVWHGLPRDRSPGEEHRRVFVATSRNEGKSFEPEHPVTDQETGACGCCALKAGCAADGTLCILYRSATERVNRDLYCLRLSAGARAASTSRLQPWRIGTCPMSSMALTVHPGGMIGAWETQGNVYFGQLASGDGVERTLAPGEPGQSKHPTLASDGEGCLLVAWTEGVGWQRGGTLAWQVFDPQGQPTRVKGRIEQAIPVWGLPSAVATREGFILFH